MSDMISAQLLFSAFGLLLIGAVFTGAVGRDWRRAGYVAVAFMAAASGLVWILAGRVLALGDLDVRVLQGFQPLGATLEFHVDKLSAIFMLVVPFVGLAAMLYSVEYMRKLHAKESPARYYPFALLLFSSIVGVVSTSNLFFFFIFWELMTLTSWALVSFERENEKSVRAAWTYFVVTHVAAACLLVGALIIYSNSGSFAFGGIADTIGLMARTSPVLVHVVMGLFLVGFATKAGMFPFGGWLPEAYPAAPGPASATFAGSMTKLGIYGIVRVFFEFLRVPHMTMVWGGTIAVLGALSIFVGTLTALREDDSKRVLSFHIIGQIGYMLLGVGTGIFFLHSNPLLATLALIAGLYHVVNHACYKSLLFLNVGAAEYQTGSRDLNRLGGLGAVMPVTMAAAIIASLSIAGIPPFSGFVSKWMIYQSAFQGGFEMPFFLLLGLVAMFVSLVTLASFMKLLGAVFLGKLSEISSEVREDVPTSMKIPQIGLSAVCVLLGVFPILPLLVLYPAAEDILGRTFVPGFAEMFGGSSFGITLSLGGATTATWGPAAAVIALVICALAAYIVGKSGKAPSRSVVSWYGGEELADEEGRSRAHGFCLPFKNAFAKVYPSLPLPEIPVARHLGKVLDFDHWLYTPLVNTCSRLVDGLSRTHSGIPRTYMVWQLLGMVAVFAILFLLIR